MYDVAEIKEQLRARQASVREQLHDSVVDAADRMADYASDVLALAERKLGGRMSRPLMLAGYYPKESEIDPLPLMGMLCNLGCKSCLPITPHEHKALSFHSWRIGDALVAGRYKTQQPQPSATRVIPQLVLVPLLAFDKQCYRLGYGGGFYDRTFAQLRPPKPQQHQPYHSSYSHHQPRFHTPLSPFGRPPPSGYQQPFSPPAKPSGRTQASVVAVGVAFAGQEIGQVPVEHHDLPLDAVVCEDGMRERKPE